MINGLLTLLGFVVLDYLMSKPQNGGANIFTKVVAKNIRRMNNANII